MHEDKLKEAFALAAGCALASCPAPSLDVGNICLATAKPVDSSMCRLTDGQNWPQPARLDAPGNGDACPRTM
jgi:hypothetical protein